ncbi:MULTISPECIES: Crp/Fnr family transcriptional regulator [Chromobacterium]|uniref:Crp/Fnr family transcriptional regulator n=2 Tax=Chromobacterium TaxID=535 RepID=A0A1W0D239_9NEIS|nr:MULTISPECIES: Crp/Fnr family transcriptional regulator [Chromobacterium]AXT47440.1 Crp/Fnr family transcriptional regulator [Chromobacterium rhizoryzae]OQS41069.1 Crp/Fnr family transcriptional regulator [Chromobacterium haemolyticum]QOD81277.1 Crp/Fnr family transcriptional regulator [Chromobacterium haemolyticum]QOZ83447.1 Crp/Fnr family transcriptional regulator [Chromobacterium sp. Rain0013]WON83554.1 Crp/Fnr family transcriptional regulator [Chromobacterium haemolyticum]
MNENHNIKALLRGTHLFGHLDNDKLDKALELAESRRLSKGEVLYNEGDSANEVYLLASGCMQVFVSDGLSKKYILQICASGELIGMVGFIDSGERSSNCAADEDSHLLVFSRESLMQLFDTEDGLPHSPEARTRIMCHLVQVVRRMSNKAKNLALMDVYGRVRILINQMLEEQDGDEMVLKKQLTQQEIADQIGSSREMVARILKELVFGRYIRLENRRIVVLKMLPVNF